MIKDSLPINICGGFITLNLGRYSLLDYPKEHLLNDKILIVNKEGEGMSIDKVELDEIIEKYFKENF